jgi:MFS family permease
VQRQSHTVKPPTKRLFACSALTITLASRSALAQDASAPGADATVDASAVIASQPTVELQPITVPIAPAVAPVIDREPLRPVVFATPPSREAFDARRGVRITAAIGASLGAGIAGALVSAGAFLIPTASCSFCVPPSFFTYTLGFTLGLGTTFFMPGAYVLAANHFNARGSYWITFGGFWGGALVGGLLGSVTAASGQLVIAIGDLVLGGLMPLAGMAIAYELSATPVDDDDALSARRAPSVQWTPSLAFGPRGEPSLSLVGSF